MEGHNPNTLDLFLQYSKSLSEDFKVGTRFMMKAMITNREGTPFITSHYTFNLQQVSN